MCGCGCRSRPLMLMRSHVCSSWIHFMAVTYTAPFFMWWIYWCCFYCWKIYYLWAHSGEKKCTAEGRRKRSSCSLKAQCVTFKSNRLLVAFSFANNQHIVPPCIHSSPEGGPAQGLWFYPAGIRKIKCDVRKQGLTFIFFATWFLTDLQTGLLMFRNTTTTTTTITMRNNNNNILIILILVLFAKD